jgi:hypothetical protein
MVDIVTSWNSYLPKFVSSRNGAFVRPANAKPEIVQLAWSLAYEKLFELNSMAFSFHHQFLFPMDSNWAESVVSDYCHHLFYCLDEIHDRSCTLEMYSATSNLPREY